MFFFFTQMTAICGLLEKKKKLCIQGDRPRHAIVYISEKLMRNIGQGGRLKTICPEMFFDFQTGGCIVNQ